MTGRRSPSFTATAEEAGQALHVAMNIIRKAIIFEPVWLSVVLGSCAMSQEKRRRGSPTFLALTRPLTCCSLSSSTKKREQHNETQSLQYARNSVSPVPCHTPHMNWCKTNYQFLEHKDQPTLIRRLKHSVHILADVQVSAVQVIMNFQSHVTYDACPTSLCCHSMPVAVAVCCGCDVCVRVGQRN